jgi:hypothetical protein
VLLLPHRFRQEDSMFARLGVARRSKLAPRGVIRSRLLTAVGIVTVVALEIGLIWVLGSTGDHVDARCMQPNVECRR